MICTEQEAKTKWCPQARVDSTASNRTGLADARNAPMCIGSACMMWVWVDRVGHVDGQLERRRGTCGLIQRGAA